MTKQVRRILQGRITFDDTAVHSGPNLLGYTKIVFLLVKKDLDMTWTGLGQDLDRTWTGLGQDLDRTWTGLGQDLDRTSK
jgi:hypothetical protein